MKQAIFHYAFAVRDLEEAKEFYVNCLDCDVGRVRDEWIDIIFFGHQLTLHKFPEKIPDQDNRIPHFGAILPWEQWRQLADTLSNRNVSFRSKPEISYQNTDAEQGKMMLVDPSGNSIELKAYKSPDKALGINHF